MKGAVSTYILESVIVAQRPHIFIGTVGPFGMTNQGVKFKVLLPRVLFQYVVNLFFENGYLEQWQCLYLVFKL